MALSLRCYRASSSHAHVLRTSSISRLIYRSCMSSSKELPVIDPSSIRIGWIGTGVMGNSMAQNMYKAGYTNMSVYSRTPSKAEPLQNIGATIVRSPREVASCSDIVFTMVGYPEDVEGVILGNDGVLSGLRKSGIVVDMTTSRPSLAESLYVAAREGEQHCVDAPVSGGDIGASNASLSIMAGGDEYVVDHLKPLFGTMGKSVQYMGAAGKGQHTKAANQIIIASTMVGVVEGLIYANAVGINVERAIDVISSGGAASFSLSSYGPRILQRDFEPGFFVHHFVKDLEIALEECRRLKITLPGLALVHQLYTGLCAQGGDALGTQALQLVLEQMNGAAVDALLVNGKQAAFDSAALAIAKEQQKFAKKPYDGYISSSRRREQNQAYKERKKRETEFEETDWGCPNCGEINFQRRVICFNCETKKPSELGGVTFKAGDWVCGCGTVSVLIYKFKELF